MICGEHFKYFLSLGNNSPKKKYSLLIYILFIHSLLFVYLIRKDGIIITSYLSIFLSLTFFLTCLFLSFDNEKKLSLKNGGFAGQFSIFFNKNKERVFLWFLLVVICAQPLEVYFYLQKNSPKASDTNMCDIDRWAFYSRKANFNKPVGFRKKRLVGHYLIKHLNVLRKKVDPNSLAVILRAPLLVYDNVKRLEKDSVDFNEISSAFKESRNVAFIISDDNDDKEMRDFNLSEKGSRAISINADDDRFKLLKFDVNFLEVRANFDSNKFLVFNSCFHPQWKAFLNGKKVKIFRANYAFKGIWVPGRYPAGDNVISFTYGTKIKLVFHFFFICLFAGALFYFCHLGFQLKNRKLTESPL